MLDAMPKAPQLEGYLNADNIFDIARILDLYKTTKTLVLDA